MKFWPIILTHSTIWRLRLWNHLQGSRAVGRLHEESGEGVAPDHVQAAHRYRRGALEQGEDAALLLGCLLLVQGLQASPGKVT